MGYLKNITTQKSGGQLGGILTIQVVRKAEVQSLGSPVNGAINSTIVLKAGASFVEWKVTPQSVGMNNTSRATKEGTSKDNSLNFFIPLDREDYRDMLKMACDDEFIVIYKYPNGRKKIFGTLASPVLFNFSHNTGNRFADANGNDCKFYYTGPENLFYYNGDNPTVAAGPAPAVVYFNGVAIRSLAPGEALYITSDYSLSDYFTVT